MLSVARIFEGLVCIAFYASICYLVFDGTARHLRPAPLQEPQQPRVVVVSAAHDFPCKTPAGDRINLLSAINKQDYGQLHGYRVVTPCALADAGLTSMWNKIGWLLKVMREEAADWFLWVDVDSVVIDVTFRLPFDRFEGKDLVTWGNATLIQAGDAQNGMNSGVMLFRKSAWSLAFLEEVARLGRIPEPQLQQVLTEQLDAPGYAYNAWLRDQNAIVYLLKKHWPEARAKLQLVNKQYCLNCYWRDLMAQGDLQSTDKRVQFINHFSGCQMCLGLNAAGDSAECESEFLKSFEYANSLMTRLLARKPPHAASRHEAVLASFHCQAHPEARECRDAQNALAMLRQGGPQLRGRQLSQRRAA